MIQKSTSKKHGSGILALSVKGHILFWIITSAYYILSTYLLHNYLYRTLVTKAFFFPFQLIAAYFMIYILLGKLLYKQKYIKAVIGFIVFIFSFSFIVYYFHDYYFRVFFAPDFEPPTFREMLYNFEDLISYYMNFSQLTPLILVCIEFVLHQYNRIQEVEELQLQKNEAELNLLKTQIHPEFLLSSLRNLEKLTAEDSDKSPEVIERLSTTLDYILYQGPKEHISLLEEIEAIDEYVALENIRFDGITQIKFDIDVDRLNTKISPLVLFSFLEFNFNHWVRETIPYSETSIHLSDKDGIVIEINNKIDSEIAKEHLYDLNSMKRQLNISYPNQYTLTAESSSNTYSINLKIDI